MALGYEYIDYDALQKAVEELNNIKNDLNQTLKNVLDEMNSSVDNRDIYLSKEATSCKQEFQQMYDRWAKKFDGYVQEYVDYFNEVSKQYTQTGETLEANVKNNNSFIG